MLRLRDLHVPDVCKFELGFGFRRLGVAWRHVEARGVGQVQREDDGYFHARIQYITDSGGINC